MLTPSCPDADHTARHSWRDTRPTALPRRGTAGATRARPPYASGAQRARHAPDRLTLAGHSGRDTRPSALRELGTAGATRARPPYASWAQRARHAPERLTIAGPIISPRCCPYPAQVLPLPCPGAAPTLPRCCLNYLIVSYLLRCVCSYYVASFLSMISPSQYTFLRRHF